MTNQVLDVIKSRRTIRAYKPDPLTDEQINVLIEAALAAPSGMNAMPYQFIVIKNKSVINELEQGIIEYIMETGNEAAIDRLKSRKNKILYDAPCLIMIVIKETHLSKIDAGIAVQSIALAAKSLGLDSVILGNPGQIFLGQNADKWVRKLKIPEGYVYGISIAVGHANMEKAPHEPDPSKITIID